MPKLATGSIHFSLLAGRILLKDVRYHSSNQTMKIVKGQIQWRYWIRRPTSEEEINSARGEECKCLITFQCEYLTVLLAKHSGRLWSCRIQLSFQGVEWFLYNRTAAYDNIIAQMEKATRPTSRSSSHGIFGRYTRQGGSSIHSVCLISPHVVYRQYLTFLPSSYCKRIPTNSSLC